MPRPLVSVVIPTFNGAAHLDESVQSARDQSLTDIEIVVVDDGSSDDTKEIAASHAAADDRVRLVADGARRGLPANWDFAVEAARGPWVKFLFQDDLLHRLCLERMLQRTDRSEFVVCQREIVGSSDHLAQLEEFRSKYLEGATLYSVFGDAAGHVSGLEFCRGVASQLRKGPLANFIGEPTCVLVSAAALRRAGRFNANLVQLPDLDMWLRLGSANGLAYVPEALCTFRIHGESATAGNKTRQQFRSGRAEQLILLDDLVHAPEFAEFRSALSERDRQSVAALLGDYAMETERRIIREFVRDPVSAAQAWRILRQLQDERRSLVVGSRRHAIAVARRIGRRGLRRVGRGAI